MKRGALAVLVLGMIWSSGDTRAADSKKPLEPTIRCPIEVKLDWGDTAIAGGSVTYKYYASTSAKCKQHDRNWPDLRGRSTIAGFSVPVNGELPVVDPSKTAGAVTWRFAPTVDVDNSWGMTEIARSPVPGSACPSEP
jgi:hypothetical protein